MGIELKFALSCPPIAPTIHHSLAALIVVCWSSCDGSCPPVNWLSSSIVTVPVNGQDRMESSLHVSLHNNDLL